MSVPLKMNMARRTSTTLDFFLPRECCEPIPPEPPVKRMAKYLGIDENLAVCVLCEFFCTTFLMYGGCSLAASRISFETKYDYDVRKSVAPARFNYEVPIGWGVWLIFTLYMGFNISGAHLNPAISFLQYALNKISFKRFFFYSLAQFLGCFVGSAFAFVVYYEGINAFDGGVRQVYGDNATADIFATYPKDYLSITGGVIDQIATTAILCAKMLCITDKRNQIPRQAQPLLLGLSLWIIVAFWSQNCGAALNPARDFGPRVFSFLVGYGWDVFSYRDYKWFMVPIICPMIGALLGGVIFKVFIGDYMPTLTQYGENCSPILPSNSLTPKPLLTPLNMPLEKCQNAFKFLPNQKIKTVFE